MFHSDKFVVFPLFRHPERAILSCLTFFLFIALGAAFAPAKAQAAASLYLEPVSGAFTVGSTFTVSLYVNTGGQSINAIETRLRFPVDKLQVVSPSTGVSLIQSWIAQPTFSNTDGTIYFQGAIPTPGINTNAGIISTITFRVRSTGTATIRISDDSRVLLNDGLGTDILGQTTGGIYNLVLPPPAGPIVVSRTHPDQARWYQLNRAVFEWATDDNVQGFSYILNQDPAGAPDNISEGAQTSVSYAGLADGTYYFHIKALRAGSWGGVTSYAVNVDATPPADFPIQISPGTRTAIRRPIISFATTDQTSGISHYEVKLIALDPPLAYVEKGDQPFFFETISPFSTELSEGRYEVIVRAYDNAGNYAQSQSRLTITRPIFEFVVTDGLRVFGYTVAWPWLVILGALMLAFLGWFARLAWMWHRIAEERLAHGIERHPTVSEKLDELRKKQEEYKSPGLKKFLGKVMDKIRGKHLIIALIFALSFGAIFGGSAFAQETDSGVGNLRVDPPIVTLFPRTASNDEIVYIGGRAGVPNAKVLIHFQSLESGSTQSYATVTDKDGAWFYSLPQFLRSGGYIVWTQLQDGDVMSAPSPQLNLNVATTALQIGRYRLTFEAMYLILFILFAAAFVSLLGWTIYHSHRGRSKHKKFDRALREAEESIRQGFAILRKDIEEELAVIRKAKLSKELSAEERLREEKLLTDIEEVSRHIGKEFWEIEHAE